MEIVEFYAFATAITALTAGLIFLAAKGAHKVCKAHRWARMVALTMALAWLSILLVPFAIFGGEWLFWGYLALPFSVLLEIVAPIGFAAYALITSIIAASFLGTVVYGVFAIVLLIGRRRYIGWGTIRR
jgi:hypothetical protein